jgi:2-polyprenyl-3-methyl-5-hydroxy-6-metoxy-1,4-benzoquinol methylase
MQVIRTLAELDAKLAECERAGGVSDAALRRVFSTFRMDFSTKVPADPFSSEYRDFQMSLYERISARTYDPRNEVTKFDVAAADRRPFPFYTGSCKTAGFFTMGLGFLLHSLDLEPGARVVEFGSGWGNTTIAMANVGLKVTAIDIEPDFCDLLRLRANRHDVELTVVNADFFWAETVTEPFDAAIFFECFHHCADHVRLLRALHTAVKPGGRVYFAAEPITRDFPLPWGLRMDGESLWAIRSNGWMELGFNEDYFREVLARTGWTVQKHEYADLGWAAVWEAKSVSEADTVSGHHSVGPAASVPGTQPPDNTSASRLKAELESVYNSTSWRITAPLRAFKRRLSF